MRFRVFVFLMSAAIMLGAATAMAQEITGSIVGRVQDATGAGVPAASVTVTNTDRNAVIRATATEADGSYVAPLLPIGHYAVAIEATRFKKAIKRDIELNVNDKLTINFDLQLGDVKQEVTVEANPVQVELQSATSQTLISGDQVRELALNSRNYEQLVSLIPGVVYTGVGDQIYVGVSNPLSGQSNAVSFAINGGRTSQNSWTVDGADNVDRGANLTLLNYPSVDAIAEFRVLRGQYSAEFGRNASGMVNVVTKSGSNQLHGDVYEFFRNDKLAANTFFNNLSGIARPPLRYNNFGYTLGGPVLIPKVYNGKDKTFFFFSQEFRRVITYTSVSGTAPTADEKAGRFAAPVCVAFTGTTCTNTDTQITNIDPVARAYIKDIWSKVPDARANHTINLALRNIFNFRQELYKIDHVFSPKWSVSVRFIKDSIPTEEPRGLFTGATLPGVSTTQTNSPGKGFMVRVTGTLSPSIINEAGYSYSYGAVLSTPIGLDASVNSPDITPKLPFPVSLGRIPTLTVTGFSTVTGFGPYLDYNRNHNWFDNLTKTTAKHTIKTGVSIIRYNKSENAAGNNVGSFTFANTPRPTGASTLQQSWAYFLLGNVSTFSQVARDITPDIRVNQAEMYVQDDYRARKNLTLNIGVRYSLFRQPTDGKGFLNNFDPALYNPANAPQIDSNGLLVPGTGDPLNGIIVNNKNSPFGSKVSNENNHDLAPRIGFSWDPFGDGKTAVRSGYGWAYDFPQVGIYQSPVTGNPYSVQSTSISNTTFQDPGAVPGSVSTSVPGLSALSIPYQTPYVQNWSLDVQRQLPGNLMLDVGYFGAKGTHLIGEPDINEAPPGAAVAAGITDANTPITRGAATTKLNRVRPYRGYSSINAIETWFNSNYNALQVALNKRFSAGSFLGISYTWSKALTDAGSDVAAPMNFYNRRADRGLAPFDRPHVLTINWSYKLPWLASRRDVLSQVAGGWQVSGIASFDSGLPVSISDSNLGTDPGGLGVLLSSSQASARPDMICNPNVAAPHTQAAWFNTACFADVPIGQVRPGNAPRYFVRGPGFQKWDMSAFKNFSFGERARLQFRAEAFNIFNHTNFASVASNLGVSSFGTVTAARDPRIIQLAFKLYF